ncbi:MAG: metallophosphoesterase, partial [Paracoccaceae bacterium]|nr:metallophosphoesterase [Paracoccaceae bacterium]
MLTFAIISDTHIRPKEGDLSSPFKVNLLANDRARYAVALIKSLKPEFTVHLGDVVHPLYHMKSYDKAWDMAREILEPLEPKLHFVPGNHDIGDKTIMDSPAKPINEISTHTYEKHQPKQRFSFETRGTLCVGINSSLFNSRTVEEEEQKDWLARTLHNSQARTKLLFSHYPPMICHQEESEHYDNYDPINRLWLLELVAQTSVDIIFSGHVHHFFFNRYKGVKL